MVYVVLGVDLCGCGWCVVGVVCIGVCVGFVWCVVGGVDWLGCVVCCGFV